MSPLKQLAAPQASTATPAPAPRYARALQASKHLQISKSTLWHWTKTRAGFPQPLRAGEKTTLFNLGELEEFIAASSAAAGAKNGK